MLAAMDRHSPARTVRDPVCGMAVDPGTAQHTSEYRGRTRYFCSADCKRRFDAEPARYATDDEADQPSTASAHHH